MCELSLEAVCLGANLTILLTHFMTSYFNLCLFRWWHLKNTDNTISYLIGLPWELYKLSLKYLKCWSVCYVKLFTWKIYDDSDMVWILKRKCLRLCSLHVSRGLYCYIYFCIPGSKEVEGCLCATLHGPLSCGGMCICSSCPLPNGLTMAVGIYTGVMIFLSCKTYAGTFMTFCNSAQELVS